MCAIQGTSASTGGKTFHSFPPPPLPHQITITQAPTSGNGREPWITPRHMDSLSRSSIISMAAAAQPIQQRSSMEYARTRGRKKGVGRGTAGVVRCSRGLGPHGTPSGRRGTSTRNHPRSTRSVHSHSVRCASKGLALENARTTQPLWVTCLASPTNDYQWGGVEKDGDRQAASFWALFLCAGATPAKTPYSDQGSASALCRRVTATAAHQRTNSRSPYGGGSFGHFSVF